MPAQLRGSDIWQRSKNEGQGGGEKSNGVQETFKPPLLMKDLCSGATLRLSAAVCSLCKQGMLVRTITAEGLKP